jgi:hypothetical protein
VRHAGCSIPGEAGAQVALDGRDALGGNQVDPRRLYPCSCWFSLDRKSLKILCSAVDFAPRVNVSLRGIVDGHLVASGRCAAGQVRIAEVDVKAYKLRRRCPELEVGHHAVAGRRSSRT